MLDSLWHGCAAVLTYLPFAILYLFAFKNNFRYSKKTSIIIMIVSVIIRMILAMCVDIATEEFEEIFNYLDFFVIMMFGILAVKSSVWIVLFVGLMLKNTVDAVVVFSKFAEHLVNPVWADMVYNWSYCVSLLIFDLFVIPILYGIIRKFYTIEIRDSISDPSWRLLWIVPMFFYVTWLYIFYYSSDMTGVQIACLPITSLYLFCSICCQNFIYICLARLVESQRAEAKLVEEKHAAQLQAVQYSYLNEKIQADQRLRHDFRHHLTTISSLAENNEIDHLKEYIAQYVTPMVWQSQIHYCNNMVLNLMALYYADKCKSNDVDCYIHLSIPDKLPLSDSEITVLFGNLLENALEACLSLPQTEKRRLTFLGSVINNSLVFSIENTCQENKPNIISGRVMSTKHEGYGIGLASSMDIVESHGGSINFETTDIFCAQIILPLADATV